LAGGRRGFGKQLWTILQVSDASVTLGLVSPDGDQGYPGTMTATCTYTLAKPATLRVELSEIVSCALRVLGMGWARGTAATATAASAGFGRAPARGISVAQYNP
jgi:hypothetical protein